MSVETSNGSPRTRLRVCSTKALDVVVEDVLGHVEALGRGADLAGVEEGRPGAAPGGDLDLGGDVRADDEGVLAAHLQVHACHPLGAGGSHLLAGGDRSGEGDAVDARVGGERGADVAGPGEEVDHAGGHVPEGLGQHQGRERRQLRGLADDAVAGGQGRCDLPGEEQQRVVPGDDAADDAERVLDDHRQLGRLDRRDHAPGVVAADLRVVVEGGRRPLQLVAVLDQRLAALGGHRPGQLLGAVAQPPRHLVQQLAALPRGRPRPRRPGLAGGRHRRVDLLGRSGRQLRDRLGRVRVLDRDRGPDPGDPLAADQQRRRLVAIGGHRCGSGYRQASCR